MNLRTFCAQEKHVIYSKLKPKVTRRSESQNEVQPPTLETITVKYCYRTRVEIEKQGTYGSSHQPC